MALKTSLVIAGDASSATAALRDTDAALAKNAAQMQRLQQATAAADKSITSLAAAQGRAKAEAEAAKTAFHNSEISVAEYNTRLLETKSALSLFEDQHRSAIKALKSANDNMGESVVSAGQARAGYQNLGRQMQDVATQLTGGANIGTIISQQGGQVADALAQMGGRFAGVAEFLAGPWGAAISGGVGLLANLAEGFISAGDAADENATALASVKIGSDALSTIQTTLGNVFDLTTGKMKDQTSVAMGLAKASLLLAEATAKQRLADANRTIDDANSKQLTFSAGFGGGFSIDRVRPLEGQVASQFRNGMINSSQAIDTLKRWQERGKITDAVATQLAAAIANAEAEAKNLKEFDDAYTNLTSGKLGGEFAKPKKERTKKPKADHSAEFGEDTARKIAGIADQFTDLPTVVERSNKAMRDLDAIVADIGRKNPPNLKELLSDVASARGLIQDSLNKPFDEYLQKAREAEQIDELLAAGKDDQAAALRDVLQLERQMEPLDAQRLDSVLATTQAAREHSMVLRDQRAIIETQVRAVQDMRGALEQTVANSLRGRFSVANVLNSLGNAWVNITSQKIVESAFGDTLRALESRASGADRVETAGEQIAQSLDQGSSAVKSFADIVVKARDAIEQHDTSGTTWAPTVNNTPRIDLSASALNDLTAAFDKAIGQKTSSADSITGPEIVVNGRRKSANVSGAGSLLVDMADGMLRSIGVKTPLVISQALTKSLTKIEKGIPEALVGAFTGQAVSKLILGGMGDGIGGAIGGAIGQKLGSTFLSKGLEQIGGKLLGSLGGPLGSIVGGLAGGLLGGLFRKAPTGYTVVTANSTSSGGNNAEAKQQTSTMGSTLQSTIQAIADQFGAALGDYAVSIGKRNDYYRVSASGSPNVSSKYFSQHNTNPDSLYDGQDAAMALSLAIQNAISDGAIKGISAAVQKALKSSSDIDKAIREALKVQEVELAIGGLGAEMEKQFRTFEVQAQERLRIAKQYGFDVIAVDQRNNEDRIKLAKQLADQQVGTLQNLIDQMTTGSLYEGSAVDQRNAILAQIATTKVEADKGTEGAADKLAQLLEQLNSVSKDAYGTTGGFAADRQTILDAARDTIAQANARIAAAEAAAKTDPALSTTNAALDENNAQNEDIITALSQSNAYLAKIAATGTSTTSALAALARTS